MTTTPSWSLFDDFSTHEAWVEHEDRLETEQHRIEEGERRRDEGIARADHYADLAWKTVARNALADAAYLLPVITSDDVWDRIEDADTHEPRAIAAVFKWGQSQGLIEPTDTFRPTVRPEAHRRPVRVWRSLIYRGESSRAA